MLLSLATSEAGPTSARFRGGVALVAQGCYAESRRFGRSFCSAVQANAESIVLRLTIIETKLMTDGMHTFGDVFFDVTCKTTGERPKFKVCFLTF